MLFLSNFIHNSLNSKGEMIGNVSTFQKTSDWENPLQEVLYDSCLIFQVSSFFLSFISLLKTTREAEVVTVLPRFWFERDELQHNNSDIRNVSSHRS